MFYPFTQYRTNYFEMMPTHKKTTASRTLAFSFAFAYFFPTITRILAQRAKNCTLG